jgi:hypothetical protein
MTYNYETGKITRDWVLKKIEGSCKCDPNRTVLIGVMCKTCPHFLKMETFYNSSREEYITGTGKIGTFVFCKYHKKDDEGTSDILHRMYEKFREEAITHFYD